MAEEELDPALLEEHLDEDDRIDPLSLFENQQTATNLAHLGYDSKDVEFCGHTFVLETIRPFMKYALGQALEPYRNTLSEPVAWAGLHVALSLASIDRDTEFCPPVNDDPVAFARARLRWLTGPQGYWQPVIDYLYAQYVEMEAKSIEAVAEIHRLSQEDRATSRPSPDSSTDKGSTPEPTDTDSPPLVPFS